MSCTHHMFAVGARCGWCLRMIAAGDATTPAAPSLVPPPMPRMPLRPAVASPSAQAQTGRDQHSPTLLDMLTPTARTSDPDTAHMAAASITPGKQRDSHQLVLRLLAEHGPLSDFDLARLATEARGSRVIPTSVGVRRKELVRAGLVVEHDRGGVSDTGSPCIRWALTASKEHAA